MGHKGAVLAARSIPNHLAPVGVERCQQVLTYHMTHKVRPVPDPPSISSVSRDGFAQPETNNGMHTKSTVQNTIPIVIKSMRLITINLSVLWRTEGSHTAALPKAPLAAVPPVYWANSR